MTDSIKKIPDEDLAQLSGGIAQRNGLIPGQWKIVKNNVEGRLALRATPVFDRSNEIGLLYNGEKIQIISGSSQSGSGRKQFIWVWSPKLNKSGWVDAAYLT